MNTLNKFIAFFGGSVGMAVFVHSGLDSMFESMADRRAAKAQDRMMAARVDAEKQRLAAAEA
eukprot:CAMPEP_0177771730 /NCGR_PEP_ID=MMETSP0491_2-20121128/11784_1 /TAXON_ID=63592 /ORGANISM="Tetraselmis chuii, Strain PLY429" /LENGTH=61 /DNA_ID=CAMNT_0019289371 /DNA_START=68 /DNA_END=253 /DNA_ORIENTATION=-